MESTQILKYCLENLKDTVLVNTYGEKSIFYNPNLTFKKGVYVLTIKEKDGKNDELSETILSKVNKMSINFIFVAISLIGMFATTPDTSHIFSSSNILGLVIILTLLLLSIFRLLSFIYYDRKGLYN
ncbi:DUF6194 family protein [Paraclostridium sordellii]|uniref:Membrane protein n=1 Tax=Paraclostridium sordellii TaxID=1505 RepID=A0A0C7G790_PARSO|nr:DUF6194 family protein [Paeniclostridium sordellii]QYE99002.1 hypothetical protein KZ987_05670 [Paeniclostridium sordellii]CEN77791.1 membrane protein [[Clostridium] sordellii] [Paeniclostridium sordellii]CEQ02877.1 membrane protein [[Clostridium] sordellii] [Paeniclostridium sordellii]